MLDLEGRRLRLGTLDVKGAAVAAVRLRNGDLDLVRALGAPLLPSLPSLQHTRFHTFCFAK